jgi:hypothetical protein
MYVLRTAHLRQLGFAPAVVSEGGTRSWLSHLQRVLTSSGAAHNILILSITTGLPASLQGEVLEGSTPRYQSSFYRSSADSRGRAPQMRLVWLLWAMLAVAVGGEQDEAQPQPVELQGERDLPREVKGDREQVLHSEPLVYLDREGGPKGFPQDKGKEEVYDGLLQEFNRRIRRYDQNVTSVR